MSNAKELQGAQAALHRRLAPIQDAFYEQKNYKSVVKTCEASLKKDPNQVWVKTYLAMARQQLGEEEEALALFASLVPMIRPLDADFVVRLLKQALDGSGQVELLARALEYLSANSGKPPLVPEMAKAETLLFHTYFRLGEFQKAAKQAMRLKQLAGDDVVKSFKFVLWNIVATFWIYKTGGAAMSLTLCERMLSKLADDGKLVSGEDVTLYCSVLQAAGKAAAATAVAEGALGANAFPFEEERLKFVCKMAQATGDKAALLAGHVKVLRVSPDEWDAWSGALASSDNHAELATLARELGAANKSKRGPRLAEIEISLLAKKLDSVADLLVAYFKDFGYKACFWGDVGRYVLALDGSNRKSALERMRLLLTDVDWETSYPLRNFSALELEDPNDPHREKRDGRNLGKVDQWGVEDEARQAEMVRRVSLAKLELTVAERRAAGEPEVVVATAKELMCQYQAACKLYRQHLQVTEEGANDDLVIVAAHHLVTLGKQLDAMAVCVAGLEHTPFAFQPKLLSVRLATAVGAFSYAGEMSRLLECKYVQFDSMGHYALYPAVQAGDFAVLEEVCRNALDFRDQAIKRSVPNDMGKCFSHGKWSQIEGFLHFAKRVDGSWHAATCQVELLLGRLLWAKSAPLSEDEATAVLEHGRRRGTVDAGCRKSTQWLEGLVEACETYRGKEDMRLVYNYDLRVQADYSTCLTKAEFLAHEWVVPQPMLDWLHGRVLTVLLLEASLTDKTAIVDSSATRLLQLIDSNRGANLLGGPVSWELLRRVAAVAPKVAACGSGGSRFDEASKALSAIAEQLQEAQRALVTEKNDVAFPCLDEGWAAEVVFAVLQLVPLVELLLASWRKMSQPSKSAQKKMTAEARAAMGDVLVQIKLCSERARELAKSASTLCGARLDKTEDELAEWISSHHSCHVSDVHLRSVAHKLHSSWKAVFTVLAQRKQ